MLKITKIKEIFIKIPRVLAEQAFITFLVLVFIALIFGGAFFYQYSFLAQKTEPEITKKPIQFKEELYQKILKQWQSREKRLQDIETKAYLDSFRGID